MPRKSKREIATEIEERTESQAVPDSVGAIEQYFSDEYPDPPQDELGDAWRDALAPDES